MKMTLFWNIDFYCEFIFRILLVCFCFVLFCFCFCFLFFVFLFYFHGLFFLKLFMCRNYAPFFRRFVIITFDTLSGKLPFFVKSRLSIFILPHSLILLAFGLSLVLSCEARLMKIATPRYSCLLSELN